MMKIFTIGFTKKSADRFFELLRDSGARHLLDIRLHNNSQLAGFTKRDDLRYFLRQLVDMEYHEIAQLAPDEPMLKAYRKSRDWAAYEKAYLQLIGARQAEKQVPPRFIEEGVVLLCSEDKPLHCHRRLAAQYLAENPQNHSEVTHL